MIHKLRGHKNVVYAIAFNLPYGDKVATGSFDSTAKVILYSIKYN
jgi:dynein assembly factor with WDR repeat domains 1